MGKDWGGIWDLGCGVWVWLGWVGFVVGYLGWRSFVSSGLMIPLGGLLSWTLYDSTVYRVI